MAFLSKQLQTLNQTVARLFEKSPLIAIGGVNTMTMIITVGMSLVIVRSLPKEEYGQIVYFYAGFGLLRLITNMGLGFHMSRNIAGVLDDTERLRTIVYSTVSIRVFSVIVLLIVAYLLSITTEQPFLEYIVIGGIVASFADLLFSILAGLRLTSRISLMTGAQPFLYAVLALLLIFLNIATAERMMQIYILAFVIQVLLGLGLIWQSRQIPRFQFHSLSFKYVRGVLLFAIPVYSITLLSQVWNTLNTAILGNRGQFDAAAEYGVGFNLITMLLSITAASLMAVFYPAISRMESLGQHKEMTEHIRDTAGLMLRLYLFAAVGMFAFAETVALIFGPSYKMSATYMVIISPLLVLLGLFPIFSQTLMSLGRPWRAVIGLIVHVSGFFVVLVIGMGMGEDISPLTLSWAAVISSAVALLIQYGLASRAVKASLIRGSHVNLILLSVAAAVILRYLASLIGTQTSIWHFVLGGVFTLIYWGPLLLSRRQSMMLKVARVETNA